MKMMKTTLMTIQSTTDPDSGFMHRNGKPQGFFYLDHRTVDSKCNIITDTFVTPGNVNDVKPYRERLEYQIEKFGFKVETVGLDAGYNTSAICKMLLEDFKIRAAMGKRRGCHQKGKYGKYKFKYIPDWDVYICPDTRCYACDAGEENINAKMTDVQIVQDGRNV